MEIAARLQSDWPAAAKGISLGARAAAVGGVLIRFLSLLGGRGVTLLFAGVFLGLALPDLAALLRPLLAPSVVLLLFFSLLRVDWLSILGHLRRPLLTAVLVTWMLLA